MNEIATRNVAASADQDRVRIVAKDKAVFIVLADGAGGLSGGAEAAELVMRHDFSHCDSAEACAEELAALDAEVASNRACGDSTVVIAVVRAGVVYGASVGDSAAWLLGHEAVVDLTGRQRHKPLLGSGDAQAVAFGPNVVAGRLLIASDGLLKYVARDTIWRLGRGDHIESAADSLVAAARLPGGGLQDDLSLVLTPGRTP